MSAEVVDVVDRRRQLVGACAGLIVVLAILVVGLWWAKWAPYLAKADRLAGVRHWSGSSIFEASGHPGTAPTLVGAWHFARVYFDAIWRALVVALLVGAGVDALAPRRWLLAVMARDTQRGRAAAGGLLSLPSMMCTCCTAPLTVGLRRRGVPLAGALAHWLGNPVLNPAVLVFLALVLPWQYVATRLSIGVILVFGISALLGRILDRSEETGCPSAAAVTAGRETDAEIIRLRDVPARYLRSLTRFVLILVPEYAVVVLGLGLVTASLSDFGAQASRLGVAALVVTAIVATLLVVPTGGEIAVILAATAAGAGPALAGVLLLALPAVSLPSMVLVGRALGWRATSLTAAAVAVMALVSGGVLAALS